MMSLEFDKVDDLVRRLLSNPFRKRPSFIYQNLLLLVILRRRQVIMGHSGICTTSGVLTSCFRTSGSGYFRSIANDDVSKDSFTGFDSKISNRILLLILNLTSFMQKSAIKKDFILIIVSSRRDRVRLIESPLHVIVFTSN